MGDGVVPLEGDDGQREDRQLGAEDAGEAGQLTGEAVLPAEGVGAEGAQRAGVHEGQRAQVDAHQQVGGGEVADEEAGDVHLSPAAAASASAAATGVSPAAAEDEDEEDGAVAEQGQGEDEPDGEAQCPPVEEVLAGGEGPRAR